MNTLPITRNLLDSAPEMLDHRIKNELLDIAMWETFNEEGNEMISARTGRKLIPTVKLKISGLEEAALYFVVIEFVNTSLKRLKYWPIDGGWRADGPEEKPIDENFYCHPNSPNYGSNWMRYPVFFRRLKISHKESGPHQVQLSKFHKYEPIVKILKFEEGNGSAHVVHKQPLPICQFIVVTAYRNKKLSTLKSRCNPFINSWKITENYVEPSNKQQKENTLPEQQKENTLPEQQKENTLPEQQKENTLPEQQKENTLPEQQKENTLPEQQKENTLPEQQKGNTLPEQQKENTLPEQHKENALPEQQKENAIPQYPSVFSEEYNRAYMQQLLMQNHGPAGSCALSCYRANGHYPHRVHPNLSPVLPIAHHLPMKAAQFVHPGSFQHTSERGYAMPGTSSNQQGHHFHQNFYSGLQMQPQNMQTLLQPFSWPYPNNLEYIYSMMNNRLNNYKMQFFRRPRRGWKQTDKKRPDDK